MMNQLDPKMSDNMEEQRTRALAEHIVDRKTVAQRIIWVTFQREGIHQFHQAATDPALADVSFLAHPHRHIFHFEVAITVFHNDREIEFIQFKRWLESLYQGTLKLDNKSCEMISDELFITIAARYHDRRITIKVSEDGENGSVINYNP